jgi:hypothetical protein
MHCHMGELVTRRLTETCFHWENEAVSPCSYGQGAEQKRLNRNQEWSYEKSKVSYAHQTNKTTINTKTLITKTFNTVHVQNKK